MNKAGKTSVCCVTNVASNVYLPHRPRLINWKVLKTQLFSTFNELRANPQAEVRVIGNSSGSVGLSSGMEAVCTCAKPNRR
jgi:hypothetical protein